jgi:glutathione S-transferase
MHPFAHDPALSLYALTGTLVALHLLVLAGWTGYARNKAKTFVNPEDAAAVKGAQADADHPDVQRAKRAHMNAIESAVPFFAVGLLYAFSGPSQLGAQVYFYTFLAARVLHSIFYLAQKQPFRTISFAVGALAITGMGVHVIRVAIAAM